MIWFVIWLIVIKIADREPLLVEAVNGWAATLTLAVALRKRVRKRELGPRPKRRSDESLHQCVLDWFGHVAATDDMIAENACKSVSMRGVGERLSPLEAPRRSADARRWSFDTVRR